MMMKPSERVCTLAYNKICRKIKKRSFRRARYVRTCTCIWRPWCWTRSIQVKIRDCEEARRSRGGNTNAAELDYTVAKGDTPCEAHHKPMNWKLVVKPFSPGANRWRSPSVICRGQPSDWRRCHRSGSLQSCLIFKHCGKRRCLFSPQQVLSDCFYFAGAVGSRIWSDS